MSTQPKSSLTPEQYLEIERKAEHKSEYWNGRMFAMSGASEEHNLIAVNLIAVLRPQVRESGCRLYSNEMRVRVDATRLYTYPDVVVVCGERRFADDKMDPLLNPMLLVEVLSPSTEAYDLGRKFEHYRAIDSLVQYLVIAQDRLNADLYTKQDGRWFLVGARSMEAIINLDSIGCKVTVADLYEDVALPPPQLSGELS